MKDALGWLSDNHVVLWILISLLACSVIFFMRSASTVLKAGGTVTFWPPRIRAATTVVGMSGRLRIELGVAEMPPGQEAFYENVKRGIRTCSVQIQYTEGFTKTPRVFLALNKLDVGGSVGSPIDRLRIKAEAETREGFRLVFETWNESIVYDAGASWIAVGE